MMITNPFKAAIRAGRLQVGFWSSIPSPVTVEVIAGSGFDWILLDMEHSPNEVALVHQQLQAAASGGAAHPAVRAYWNDFVLIKRLLDLGVQTLLVPYVETAEEARRAVAATRYPPRGNRGVAGTTRASRFGRIQDYFDRAEAEICLMLQIESKKGLDNLEEIAAVDGVDVLFIGPNDFAAGLGHLGAAGHPEVQAAIEDAMRRILACDKVAGFLTPDESQARRWIDLGCKVAAVGADIGLLARGSEALAARFKDRPQD